MNASSCKPSLKMTFIIPFSQATSVPFFCRSHSAASLTRSILRGSTTISFAPCSRTARRITVAITGCVSVVLEPVTKMQAACSSSSMGFVIAPDPKAAARPATVEA